MTSFFLGTINSDECKWEVKLVSVIGCIKCFCKLGMISIVVFKSCQFCIARTDSLIKVSSSQRANSSTAENISISLAQKCCLVQLNFSRKTMPTEHFFSLQWKLQQVVEMKQLFSDGIVRHKLYGSVFIHQMRFDEWPSFHTNGLFLPAQSGQQSMTQLCFFHTQWQNWWQCCKLSFGLQGRLAMTLSLNSWIRFHDFCCCFNWQWISWLHQGFITMTSLVKVPSMCWLFSQHVIHDHHGRQLHTILMFEFFSSTPTMMLIGQWLNGSLMHACTFHHLLSVLSNIFVVATQRFPLLHPLFVVANDFAQTSSILMLPAHWQKTHHIHVFDDMLENSLDPFASNLWLSMAVNATAVFVDCPNAALAPVLQVFCFNLHFLNCSAAAGAPLWMTPRPNTVGLNKWTSPALVRVQCASQFAAMVGLSVQNSHCAMLRSLWRWTGGVFSGCHSAVGSWWSRQGFVLEPKLRGES